MNDFLNGWSQGMTGSGSGLPSQSVLEAMGRDAARNQWNNNQARPGGTASPVASAPGTPLTAVLYQAGKNMRLKKLARDFGIALALILAGALWSAIFPRNTSLNWIAVIPSIPGYVWMLWVFMRLPVYAIAKVGRLLENNKEI